ncbi:MAG: hypothetical protein KGZ35_05025 [Truepera sp.]|nr:hypothetical protein [Truepera sp.]
MGFFSVISEKISAMREHAKDKKEFLASLIRAAEDGKLTEDEIKEIQTRYKELELTQDDLRGVRAKAYNAALRATKADRVVTAEEEAELVKLQQLLMIPESEIAKSKQELARLRLLTEIQNGNPPTIAVPNVILQKGELAYWSEPASILEERVVKRRYEGGSQGFSFRIAKGLSYRVGGHRGHIVTDTAVVPVSFGELIVTNKRVIFRGDAKSFNIRLDKLLELNLYSDGVRLTDDKGKPRMVKFDDERNTDVVGATLSYAINRFAS